MNTIFKVGDTAEFTAPYMEHKVGDRFTVTAVAPSNIHAGEQLVQGRKPNNHSGVYSSRLKLVESAEHEYKVGDKVEVLERSRCHEVGPGEVTEVESGMFRVKQPQHGNGAGWWLLPKHVRPLAEKTLEVGYTIEALENVWSRVPKGTRLIVTNLHPNGNVQARVADSEDTFPWYMRPHQFKVVPAKQELKFEVGARVRGDKYYYGDAEGTVTRLDGPFGGDIEIAWETGRALQGLPLGATRSRLEVIAPAPTKKKATLVDDKNKPQIGDTIVAFWEKNGVKTRKKGVVASIDRDGDYETAGGEYINYDGDNYPENAPHVYIVERATRPAPVKVDPNQKWIDAPIGSIAISPKHKFQWSKTGENEWTYFNTTDGRTFKDRTNETIGTAEGTFLVTF